MIVLELFRRQRLVCESRVVADTPRGPILRIIFRGGRWEQGNEMRRFMQEAINAHHPAGVVLDLLTLRYGLGNDICLLSKPLFDGAKKQVRPLCILAKGQTARNLRDLWDLPHVPGLAGEPYFTNIAEGMEYLTARLKNTA